MLDTRCVDVCKTIWIENGTFSINDTTDASLGKQEGESYDLSQFAVGSTDFSLARPLVRISHFAAVDMTASLVARN